MKAAEHHLAVFGGDARAGVVDHQSQGFADVTTFDIRCPAAVLSRIFEQIRDDAFEPDRIHFMHDRAAVDLQSLLDTFRGRMARNQRRDVDEFADDLVLFRVDASEFQ